VPKAKTKTPVEEPKVVEPVQIEVLTPRAVEARQAERMMDLEDRVLERNLVILDGAARFHEIDPEAEAPPPEWVRELGQERAMERFRLAKYALMPAGAAPMGMKMAAPVVVGIMKAKAARDSGPKMTLNAALFQIPIADQVTYPTKRLPPRTDQK